MSYPLSRPMRLRRRINSSVLSTVMRHAKLRCLTVVLPPAWRSRSATVSSLSRGVRWHRTFFWWNVMDFRFTVEQEAFRQEIHAFVRAALPEPPDIPED